MIGAIAVAIVAERRGIQPPLLLAAVGLVASFIPGFRRIELDPQLILAVMVPPLLFSAAGEFSAVSFIRRFGSILNLGLLLVVVTTVIVGLIAFELVPEMTLPAAMVLAAVVSPPDAVTAVAVGGQLGLPERVMTVLKGESLINDAAALTLFAFATASVTGAHLIIPNLFLYLLYSAGVGVVVGLVLGALVHRVRMRLDNPSLVTVLSVVVPFAAYLVAEELGASGVLAVVAAGFYLGHNASRTSYDSRIQERQFWRTADALLETFVFAYIGLQLRFVAGDAIASGIGIADVAGVSLAVLFGVIVVRLAWVFLTGAIVKWRYPRLLAARARMAPDDRRLHRDLPPPFTWRENLVLGWTGMRGVVTLAAAAGIPLTALDGTPFPGRDIAVVVAFVVTIGTLLLQGLTLPWLIRRLKLADPDEAARRTAQGQLAQRLMRDAMSDAVVAYRSAHAGDEAVQAVANVMLRRFKSERGSEVPATPERNVAMLGLTAAALAARRQALLKARDERRLDDDVMREELEKLDLEEAVVANWTPDRFGRPAEDPVEE